ncbi:MAG: hypothetical protein ACLQGU_11955 [bacterium]
MPDETDSILRIAAVDMFRTLSLFAAKEEITLENVRQRLCVDRKKFPYRGDFLWSTARDVAQELIRLEYVEGGPLPKDRLLYQEYSSKTFGVTSSGRALVEKFTVDRPGAYDMLFLRMYENHSYLRAFVKALQRNDLLVPVLTSYKDHVSSRYTYGSQLIDDIASGHLYDELLMHSISSRVGCSLSEPEKNEIKDKIERVVLEAGSSAVSKTDAGEFSRAFLVKLNEAIIPVLMARHGIGFDFRTHRHLWGLGPEFQTWWATTSHPQYDATLVFKTARFIGGTSQEHLGGLSFDSGLLATRANFLEKLYLAYKKIQVLTKLTYAPALELRAVFCHEQKCQPTVFDRLLDEHSMGSNNYILQMETLRQKLARHEQPIRVGSRSIGSIRVIQK